MDRIRCIVFELCGSHLSLLDRRRAKENGFGKCRPYLLNSIVFKEKFLDVVLTEYESVLIGGKFTPNGVTATPSDIKRRMIADGDIFHF